MEKILSPKSDYFLEKHAFYTAMHFAYGYPEWLEQLGALSHIKPVDYSGLPGSPSTTGDPTPELAMRMGSLRSRIELVEEACREADPELYPWLLRGVTCEGVTYSYLYALEKPIPCSRRTYCRRRRKFFWLLWRKLEKRI